MARPKPTVLKRLEQADGTLWNILQAPAVYVLTYQGQPFNMVSTNVFGDSPRKYKKITYATEGSARYRVIELNRLFDTEDFAYVKLGVEQ